MPKAVMYAVALVDAAATAVVNPLPLGAEQLLYGPVAPALSAGEFVV